MLVSTQWMGGWADDWRVKISRNLPWRTYTPTPGSSCPFSEPLAHAVTPLVSWMPPAAHDPNLTSTELKIFCWMKPSHCVYRHKQSSPTLPEVPRHVTDNWPSPLSINYPVLLPKSHEQWGRLSGGENRTFPQTNDMPPKNNCVTAEIAHRLVHGILSNFLF